MVLLACGVRARRARLARTTIVVLLALSLPAAWSLRGDRSDTSRPEPTPKAFAGPARMPVVAVVHPTRPPLDVSRRTILDLLAQGSPNWRALGEPASPLHLFVGSNAAASPLVASALRGRSPAIGRDADAIRAVELDPDALALVGAGAVGPSVRTLRLDGVDPLRDPASYPLLGPGPAPAPAITAIAAGDIMLARAVHRKMVATGDFASPFRAVAARLAGADLAFANLEGAMSARLKPLASGMRFVASARGLEGLRLAGLDVLSLANNHTGDFGARTLVETVGLLHGAGIATIGAGEDLEQALAPAVVERGGVRFGFLAFNSIIGTAAPGPHRAGAAQIRMAPWFPFSDADLARELGAVRDARSKVDVLIVFPHWGQEYTNVPNADQRRVARALVDAGADLVIATHPHWVQGAEIYRGKLIAYSLGNFVFDQTWSRETQEGVALQMVFWGKDLKAAEFVPVRIENAHRPRFLSWRAGRAILARLWRGSGAPYRRGPPQRDPGSSPS